MGLFFHFFSGSLEERRERRAGQNLLGAQQILVLQTAVVEQLDGGKVERRRVVHQHKRRIERMRNALVHNRAVLFDKRQRKTAGRRLLRVC